MFVYANNSLLNSFSLFSVLLTFSPALWILPKCKSATVICMVYHLKRKFSAVCHMLQSRFHEQCHISFTSNSLKRSKQKIIFLHIFSIKVLPF